jgi:hypothetical protein
MEVPFCCCDSAMQPNRDSSEWVLERQVPVFDCALEIRRCCVCECSHGLGAGDVTDSHQGKVVASIHLTRRKRPGGVASD